MNARNKIALLQKLYTPAVKTMSTLNSNYLQNILPALAEKMPYKWRVQSFSKNKAEATCVAYIDSRDVMDRLDKVCIYGWERSHSEIKGNIYAVVTIIMPDGSRISRMDCGTESSTEKEKGESSDSFKRAAVNWGVGRFLYDLEIKRLPANAKKESNNWPYVVDANGKQVWDLTKHINSMSGNAPRQPAAPKPQTVPANLTISDEQFKMLNDLLDTAGVDKQKFCESYGIPSVAALPDEKFQNAVHRLNATIKKIGEKK
jgi:hypothetical protein